jgi:hypothetical protein
MSVRVDDAGVQVELAAGLGRGQVDQFPPGFIGYDWQRGVCPRRDEGLSTVGSAPLLPGFPAAWGAGPAACAVTARVPRSRSPRPLLPLNVTGIAVFRLLHVTHVLSVGLWSGMEA